MQKEPLYHRSEELNIKSAIKVNILASEFDQQFAQSQIKINPWHREEEKQDTNNHMPALTHLKATSSLFLSEMIALQERIQNKNQIQTSNKLWE